MSKSLQKSIEDKWQKKWKENKTFEPKIEKNKEKFFTTVPYPYANSVLHIGHGRGYTTPDIYTRFQRLKGKNVLFPMAYHISGTPVLAVSDSIKRGDKKQIELTRNAISDYTKDTVEQDKILESFKEPMNIANYFSKTIEGSLDSLGISIDWSRQFTTGDKTYQKFIEWQFKKLQEKKVLVQGKYPILYSPKDKNAVGEDDIKDGDTDKVALSEMTYILFQIKGTKEFIAVATLRPDALFGTTNLWSNENMDLIKVEVNKQIWITSKATLTKLEHQFDNVKLIKEIKGKEIIGKTIITPITNREVIIAKANFIDENHGTGIVYSSPAGAPHDFIALEEAKKEGRLPKNIEVINTVETKDKKGNMIQIENSCAAEDKIKKFKIKSSKDTEKLEQAKQELYKEEHFSGKLNNLCGEFEGMPVKFAKDKVKEKLVKLNLGGTLYETSRRATTRGGDQVIVANLEGQWFLDYTNEKVKENAYKLLEEMSFYPSKLRDTQKGYLKWVAMRPCARRRGIGTPLPFDKNWVIESLSDSTIYQMLYLIHNTLKKEKIESKQLEPIVFEYVFLGEGNPTVISEETNIKKETLEEMREQVIYWQNVDFRYTGGTHLSNHLSFMIYHYSLIFPEKNWPKNITVGGMLIKDGAKISKSKGNGIPLIRVKENYGVDLYRLYIAVGANYDIEMDFRDEEIIQLEKKFNKFKDLIENSINQKGKKYEEFSQTNRWLISSFYTKVKTYFDHFENLRIREAYVEVLYNFLSDVNYHERRTNEKETLEVIKFISKDYLKIMTPATPHICEEIWEKLGEKSFISLESFNTNTKKFINKEIEELEAIPRELISLISRTKESKQLEKITEIEIIQASDERFKLFDTLKELLKEKTPPKEIMQKLNQEFPNEKKFIGKFVPKTFGEGLSMYLPKNKEKELLESILDYLKEEFDVTSVNIVEKEENAQNSALPTKPSILIS